MKTDFKDTPREFRVGADGQITIRDCGKVFLDPDEQVTFTTPQGAEYDVVRKDWGYYATPSVNDRLKRFNFKTALVRNSKGQVYIMIVEKDRLSAFEAYLAAEKNYLLQWLDEMPLETLR